MRININHDSRPAAELRACVGQTAFHGLVPARHEDRGERVLGRPVRQLKRDRFPNTNLEEQNRSSSNIWRLCRSRAN